MAKEKKVDISELRKKRMEAKAREKAAKAEIDAIDAQLLLVIPRKEEVEGLIHEFYEKKTPSWKNIAEKFLNQLIPASKREVAKTIIESNTTTAEVEYIRMVND
jgi:hypothetical protein